MKGIVFATALALGVAGVAMPSSASTLDDILAGDYLPSIHVTAPATVPLNSQMTFHIDYSIALPVGETATLALQGPALLGLPSSFVPNIPLSGMSGSTDLPFIFTDGFIGGRDILFRIIATYFAPSGDPEPMPPLTGAAGVLLTTTAAIAPTPIPAALPLFASALGGLGFVGWRRKQAVQRPD